MFSRQIYYQKNLDNDEGNYTDEPDLLNPTIGNLLGSQVSEDAHFPCIDIDQGEMYESGYRSWLIKLQANPGSSIAAEAIGKFVDMLRVLGLCDFTSIDGNYVYVEFNCTVWKCPSSTDKHFHLFIDKSLTTEEYGNLLIAMRNVGLVESGYLRAFEIHEQTFVRTDRTKPIKRKL